ncbi:helix-turn-helix domain-containing protein [Winogradskyella forsetii]|uniref:helix-turn-helix domain-containing protein n=1 Tax=Winogradskyella forsetii TaxID=2686077 RepID=UPI0015C058FD|nr:AraC family transcriptional regulator [Winogradskyella forsetii]
MYKKILLILRLKRIALVALCLSVLCSLPVCAQNDDLYAKAKEFVNSNPDESIKIAEHLLKTSSENQGKAMANLLLSQCYMIKGDYNRALNYAFNEYSQFEDVNVITRIENFILKATLLRELRLNQQSQYYLDKGQALTVGLDSKSRDSLLFLIKLETIKMLLNNRDTQEALDSLNKIEKESKSFLSQHVNQNRGLLLSKLRAFSDLSKYDSAFVCIDKIMALMKVGPLNSLYEKACIYRELGHLQLQKKEFSKSEETLFIALKYAEILDNPFLSERVNRDLAINYLASNKKNQHRVYNNEFLVLNTKVELIEQESVNTYYNIVTEQDNNRVLAESQKYRKYHYILLTITLVLVMIGIFVLQKSESRKKRLREIINYLEVSRTKIINTKTTPKTSKKQIAIPEETERAILAKIKSFEKSKMFLNKDISLAFLAGNFETNTKYLSGVIHKHYNDNFNTFINKMRINYIIEKLKNDTVYMNYKISYLASECGFTTHSRFATVFKSVIGMSPVTFIDLLKEEREALDKTND